MDYKKIIKSRDLRRKILSLLSFIPDEPMLKLQYRIKFGRKLDLKNPMRFTEKIQYYKLHYKNPLLVQCVDKYDVREYIKQKGFEEILIPCYGVFNSVDEINWDTLPDQFVMKDTLGGGGGSVIIIRDKKQMDIAELKRRGTEWTSSNAHVKNDGREWPYYNGKRHRIIIEKYLEADESKGGLIDYKFFVIHGKTVYLNVMGDRIFGKSVKASLFDRDFEKLNVIRVGDKLFPKATKPENYETMREIAETLGADFPHVRVDLYDVDNKILFGELTFYSSSGYLEYEPDSFDYEIGALWDMEELKGR